MGSQGSPSLSDGLTFSNIGPRVPSFTVTYSGRRLSEETDPIFKEINSYPKGGTYVPDVVPRERRGAYPADFIEGSEEEGPKVVISSFGAEFSTSSIMSSLTMRTLMNQLEKYGLPSSYTPTLFGKHCRANNPS